MPRIDPRRQRRQPPPPVTGDYPAPPHMLPIDPQPSSRRSSRSKSAAGGTSRATDQSGQARWSDAPASATPGHLQPPRRTKPQHAGAAGRLGTTKQANQPPRAPLDGSQRRPPDASVASSDTTRLLAFILDELIRVPGTRFRFGLDPVLGFIPGLGDAAGSAISSIILIEAVRQRVPYAVLVRMGGNLFIDGLLGLIPFVGDAADAAHRANSKNVRLLDRTVASGQRVETDGIGYVIGAAAIVVVILAVVIGLAILGIWALLRVLGIV